MARLEVQGIVSAANGLPYVQGRQLDDEGTVVAGWTFTPSEARDVAHKMVEASMNAVYDAAIVAWANQEWPDQPEMGAMLISKIREFRADSWGLPDQPDDWRPERGPDAD